jgi:hypothetical protein
MKKAVIVLLTMLLFIFSTGCTTQSNKPYPYLSECIESQMYIHPITGVDAAGRAPDDPYYGGLSDWGTSGGNFGYSGINSYLRDNSDYDSKNAWKKCIEGANNSYR